MKKINKTPLAAAMGVAFISTFAMNAANAEASPFGMTELSQGYMQVAEADKAAEMACGANMKMDDATKAKIPEGACAGAKHPTEEKHVMGEKPATATKAPEGKCGDMMDGDKMKKGMEASCGAMMKGKEGACGAMGAGESMKGKEGACGAAMKGCGEGMVGCGDMMKGKEGACAANKAEAAKTPAVPAPATK
ncbi:MAG: hypothetical protein EXR80_02125 [Methylococcales bacterium]|nr:hypothetical protein [Methylococcales bacterium]